MNSFQDLLERQKAPLRDGRDAKLARKNHTRAKKVAKSAA